jgi:hypothetical protein
MVRKTRRNEKEAYALSLAIQIGCSGAHKLPDGSWQPCASPEELERLSNAAEEDNWLKRNTIGSLRERDERAREMLGKGALIEARKRGAKRKPKRRRRDPWGEAAERDEGENLREYGAFGVEAIPGLGIVSIKGGAVPAGAPRDTDPDVFTDPDSARVRSRQLGCIGVSRRISKSGKTVWMPCTNMSDYSRLTGSTALGRRGMAAGTRRTIRQIVDEELRKRRRR